MIQEILGKTNFAGRDGFYWWIGQVETPKGSQAKGDDRYKVRIVGQHLKDCNAVAYDDLPWAVVMMPATAPRREGQTDYQTIKYQSGDWVVGFFLDGVDGQQPVIMGSIGKQYKATTNVNIDKPDNGSNCLGFTSFADKTVNPNLGVSKEDKGKIAAGATAGATGDPVDLNKPPNASNDNASDLLLGTKCCNSETNPGGEFICVEVSDAKCEDGEKTTSNFELVLTELFSNVSNSGGQIGSKIVSKYTGYLYDYLDIGKGYISKVQRLTKSLLSRIKGEMFALIKQGAKAIIDFLLTEEVPDLDSSGVFNGPYINPEEAVTAPKKRVGRLRGLTKWLNEQLAKINCSIEDLDERLMKFVEDLIYDYLFKVFSAATCVIDQIINDILSQITSFLDSAINAILGPLQSLLGIIANPLDIIGQALALAFDLLGISCGGPGTDCAKENKECTGPCGGESEDGYGLDDLIADIENGNLLGDSVCSAGQVATPVIPTVAVVAGGTTLPSGYTSTVPATYPPSVTSPLASSVFAPASPAGSPVVPAAGAPVASGGVLPAGGVSPALAPAPAALVSPLLALISPVSAIISSTGSTGFSGSVSSVVFSSTSSPSSPSLVTASTTNRFRLSSATTSAFNPTFLSTSAVSYALYVDRSLVFEGDSVTITLIANGGVVPDGTVFNYAMFGTNITGSDFADGTTSGTMIMYSNVATKVISIVEDTVFEGSETVSFNVSQASQSVPFTIVGSEIEEEELPDEIPAFTPPVLGPPEVCSDGRILYIPIISRGDPYNTPPFVVIRGAGYGASASVRLDREGYLSEVVVERSGIGYSPNRTELKCSVNSFRIISTGVGYYTEPTVYVDGMSNVARPIIDADGRLSNIELVNKALTFECTPKVEILGGSGLGARAIAIMNCRDDADYLRFQQGVAPSGVDEVIDCP
jgi:hypothetical protein